MHVYYWGKYVIFEKPLKSSLIIKIEEVKKILVSFHLFAPHCEENSTVVSINDENRSVKTSQI